MSDTNYINDMPTTEIHPANNCTQMRGSNVNYRSGLMEAEEAPTSHRGMYGGHMPNNNMCDNVVTSLCTTNDMMMNCDGPFATIGAVKDDERSPSDATLSQGIDTHSQLQHQQQQQQQQQHLLGFINESEKVEAQSSEFCENQTVNEPKCDNTLLINSIRDYSNGAAVVNQLDSRVSKSGKKKMGTGRGRPRKALVAMYHSQISGDKNTIKIRIKKSNFTAQVQLTPNKKKSGRRKRRKVTSDTDISDYEQQNTVKNCKLTVSNDNDVTSTQDHEPQEQSVWGEKIPETILYKIFQQVCYLDGCLPNLVKLCQVCHLWRKVAVTPTLWRKIDLNYVKEGFRSDLQLHWLIYNRLACCQDLNLGEWKIRDVNAAIEAICVHCPELRGLNLSGWKGLNADGLKSLTTECKNLERLDLSSVNSTSAINAQPLVALGQTMGNRLTHLVLAHNKMAGFTQIINSFAANCPNLQLLDISNIRTFAHNSALLHVEKLQVGCPKLRILRITNSQIWLAPTSLTEQVASPGFPKLEELSLAGLEEDKTTTSRSVDDDGIERILKNSTKLRLLDVRGCIRLTDSGLVKVPAWDLEHLFLSACYITRTQNSGLELIVQKWSHSLLEVDLAWSTATDSLDAAVKALAEKKSESKLRSLNLCGSSISLDAVKAVLTSCPNLHSINLQSCRGLPRGIKRLYTGDAVIELKNSLQDRSKNEIMDSESEQSPAHTVAIAE